MNEDRNLLDDFCIKFCNIVEKHCKYAIVSGFMVIALGRVRGTEDIDMIIEKLDKEKFVKLFDELISNDFVCMQGDDPENLYEEYSKDYIPLRFTMNDDPFPQMEIKIAKDELDKYTLDSRVKIDLTSLEVWFGTVESTVAFKEGLLKSQKDLEDAKHLRDSYDIDESEVRKVKDLIKKYRL